MLETCSLSESQREGETFRSNELTADLRQLYRERPCYVCQRPAWCGHRQPALDRAELLAGTGGGDLPAMVVFAYLGREPAASGIEIHTLRPTLPQLPQRPQPPPAGHQDVKMSSTALPGGAAAVDIKIASPPPARKPLLRERVRAALAQAPTHPGARHGVPAPAWMARREKYLRAKA